MGWDTRLASAMKFASAPEGWARSVSDLPELHSTHPLLTEDDSDLDLNTSFMSHGRAVTEGPRPRSRHHFSALAAASTIDSALKFLPVKPKVVKAPSRNVNAFLCLLSLALGCLIPTLVDFSKTAKAYGPNGAILTVLPYTALSLLRAESAFNVGLGLAVICFVQPSGGFAPLWSIKSHVSMLPLTLVYCIGDAIALLAMGSGGGPLYVAAGNAKLLFAAAFSQCLLGRRQTVRQWSLLVTICAAATAYAALGSKKGGPSAMQALYVGLAFALGKAALSGFAAVLAEGRYRDLNIWHANTLLKAQSLAIAFIATLFRPIVVSDMPVCSESFLAAVASGTAHRVDQAPDWCLSHFGWDAWSWAVLFAEIGTGWISVIMVTRMSSIAKFVCKTATAPSLYLLYCLFGWGGLRFELPRFLTVAAITACIGAYAADGVGAGDKTQASPLKVNGESVHSKPLAAAEAGEGKWAAEYAAPKRAPFPPPHRPATNVVPVVPGQSRAA